MSHAFLAHNVEMLLLSGLFYPEQYLSSVNYGLDLHALRKRSLLGLSSVCFSGASGFQMSFDDTIGSTPPNFPPVIPSCLGSCAAARRDAACRGNERTPGIG